MRPELNCWPGISSRIRSVGVGIENLLKLDYIYQDGGIEKKREAIGSMYPEKLTFDGGRLRTTRINDAVQIIYALDKAFSENEKGQSEMISALSSQVGAAGFEPATSRSQTWRDNRATLRPEHPFLAGGKSKQLTLNLKTSFKPGYQWKRTATRMGPDLIPLSRETPPDGFLPLP